MTRQKKSKECPQCHGNKKIHGTCVCDSEWRGTQDGDDWNECQCEPEQPCPTCQGTGVVEVGP